MNVVRDVYMRQPVVYATAGRRAFPFDCVPGALHAPIRKIGKAVSRRKHRPVGQTFLPADDVAPGKRFVTAAPGVAEGLSLSRP